MILRCQLGRQTPDPRCGWAASLTVGRWGPQPSPLLSETELPMQTFGLEEAQALTQELTDFSCSSSRLLRYVETPGDGRTHFHWLFLGLNALSEFRSTFLNCFASKFSTFD